MKTLWLILFVILSSSASASAKMATKAKIKNKFGENFFRGIQAAPNDGEALSLNDVPADLIEKIEKNRKALARDKETFLKSKNIIVMDLPNDLGPSYIILYFDNAGKLKAALSESGKYTSCSRFRIKRTNLYYICSGNEGGLSWKNKIHYDFKEMKISVKNE
jgi:hypothetical protein